MQSTDQPALIPIPFAQSGGRSVIPNTSQIGITDGAASWPDGFPPLTRTPPASGGIPPSGLEMNGVLWSLSANVRWWNAGGNPKRSAGFQSDIGGYHSGAMLQSSDNVGWWRSTADNNTTDPEAGGANWDPIQGYGVLALTLASSNVTVTPLQALRRQIVLTGTLGANISLILPANRQEWLILNNTSGAFTITARTASGSGVALMAGPNVLYGDGANIRHAAASTTSLGTNGYRITPDGLIDQWGTIAVGDILAGVTTLSGTFNIAFPVAVNNVQLTVEDSTGNGYVRPNLRSKTLSGFTYTLLDDSTTGIQNISVHWRALGR